SIKDEEMGCVPTATRISALSCQVFEKLEAALNANAAARFANQLRPRFGMSGMLLAIHSLNGH
ncbi:MAG TPA: hypothetical protein VK956_14900, partial [Verrucomicrobium sp.]|nr:hypothetical protein [Verrucomicrobium sp.]